MADSTATVTYSRCDPVEVLTLLQDAERKGKGGASDTLADLLQQGQCFRVMRGGVLVGAYLLKPCGAELFILAAAGRGNLDMTAVMLTIIEAQAAAFDTVAFRTIRRGLAKRALDLGYVRQGDIYRKRIRQ